MIELEAGVEFVFEVVSIYGLASSACACGVAPLYHEVLDDPMEDCAPIVALHAELDKIAHGLEGHSDSGSNHFTSLSPCMNPDDW